VHATTRGLQSEMGIVSCSSIMIQSTDGFLRRTRQRCWQEQDSGPLCAAFVVRMSITVLQSTVRRKGRVNPRQSAQRELVSRCLRMPRVGTSAQPAPRLRFQWCGDQCLQMPKFIRTMCQTCQTAQSRCVSGSRAVRGHGVGKGSKDYLGNTAALRRVDRGPGGLLLQLHLLLLGELSTAATNLES